MAGTGGCESRDEEEVEPMHAWLQSIRMHLEAAELREVLRQSDERQKQLQAELQEAKAEAAEAAAQKAKVEDLTGKLVTVQAQLATKNLQLQEPSTTGPLLSTQPVTSFQAEKRPSEALSAPPGLFLKSETCRPAASPTAPILGTVPTSTGSLPRLLGNRGPPPGLPHPAKVVDAPILQTEPVRIE
ncbi:unnamed protein product [Durusdinium trenchii]|uniref:PH domain-containing protein n=1 Tax=Durusdinium trenchii TaxID=1381693 RepID=A0ABP0QFY3_9DINO